MKGKVLKCRSVSPGKAEGEVLYTEQAISFFGGVDAKTGKIVERGHELEGKAMAGKILVFPHGKGSTVGSYVIYALKKYGKAPLAIVNEECETIIAAGAILAGIPCVDGIDIKLLKNARRIRVDAERSEIEILE